MRTALPSAWGMRACGEREKHRGDAVKQVGDRPGLRGIAARLPAWLTGLVWLPILGLPMLSDDYDLLWAFRDGGLRGEWFTAPAPFFRPGMGVIFLLQDWVAGDWAWPRHLVSLLVHLGCTFLVGRLAERLKPGSGVAAGALFGLLACHGEATAWGAAQGDLFAALFGLIYLLAGLERRGWASAALVAACTCKESAVALPLVLWCLRGRPGWDLLFPPLWLSLRAYMLGDWLAGYGGGVHLPVDKLRYVASVATFALRTLLPPVLPHPVALWEWALLLGIGGGALAVYVKVWQWRRLELRLALAWGAALLPVLALGARMDRFEAERFLYLPSVFACLLVAGRVRLWPLVGLQLIGVALSLSAWFQSAAQVEGVRHWMETRAAPPVVLLLPDGVAGTYSLRNGASGLWRSVHPESVATFEVPMRVGSPRFGVPVEVVWTGSEWAFASEGGWFTGVNPAGEGWFWDGEGMRRLVGGAE